MANRPVEPAHPLRAGILFSESGASSLLTLVAVLALSVGIGLNAGAFTILNYVFLNPPTKKDHSNFVQIYPRYQG